MRRHTAIDARAGTGASTARTVAAVLIALGLAALLWVHRESRDSYPLPLATTTDDYLHAPTSDPSLPDLRATMRQKDGGDEVAQAPSF